jgi:hypothetical protein
MTNAIRALSIQQPWAALILSGTKDVENRTWSTDWRGQLVIHAGQRRDQRALTALIECGYELDPHLPTGGYLGTVQLVDVHPSQGDCCRWGEPGVYHWVLADAKPFAAPIPGKGQLRLYPPPADVLRAAIDRPAARL